MDVYTNATPVMMGPETMTLIYVPGDHRILQPHTFVKEGGGTPGGVTPGGVTPGEIASRMATALCGAMVAVRDPASSVSLPPPFLPARLRCITGIRQETHRGSSISSSSSKGDVALRIRFLLEGGEHVTAEELLPTRIEDMTDLQVDGILSERALWEVATRTPDHAVKDIACVVHRL